MLQRFSVKLPVRRWLKLAWIVTGLATVPMALPLAVWAATPTQTAMTSSQSVPLKLAEADECQGNGTVTHAGETQNYWVYVCNEADANYYVSYPKDGSAGIVVPCANGWVRGHEDAICAAINGDYNYFVYPTSLLVTKDGQVILNEEMLVFDGNSQGG